MTGLIGFSSGYRAMEHCDALLMLGTDFPYRPFYPDDVPVVQVDLRGERIGRRVPVRVPLVGTVKDTVDALLPLITPKTDTAHLDRMTAHYRRARARLDRLAEPSRGNRPLHPQHVAAMINRLATEDAAFTVDVGTPSIWAARYLHMNGRRRLIGSFTHGSMANALPQAIGIQAVDRARQVFALSGDGGLAMLLGELLTLRQQRLPVKIVVFNNSALSFVELEMKAAGIVTYGTDVPDSDFGAIAKAAGLFGVRVDTAEQLEPALRDALAYDGPAVVDVAHRPPGTVAATQTHLRTDQGLHPVRHPHDPLRQRRRDRRTRTHQPATARPRVSTVPGGRTTRRTLRIWAVRHELAGDRGTRAGARGPQQSRRDPRQPLRPGVRRLLRRDGAGGYRSAAQPGRRRPPGRPRAGHGPDSRRRRLLRERAPTAPDRQTRAAHPARRTLGSAAAGAGDPAARAPGPSRCCAR